MAVAKATIYTNPFRVAAVPGKPELPGGPPRFRPVVFLGKDQQVWIGKGHYLTEAEAVAHGEASVVRAFKALLDNHEDIG